MSQSSGSTRLALSGPTPAPVWTQNLPNPFRTSTRIVFPLDGEEHVRVEIYDVRGRRLRTLVDGVRPAGSNVVAWDARDRSGNRLTAGVYWCRIETPTRREARKLVIVR
jgi:endoglucanase